MRSDRFVGLFYFLWHDNPGGKRHDGDGPYDVSKILARDPGALEKPDSPLWGPKGAAHYWGEPLYGYYQSTDPWVLGRHARLLSAAGIDTLIFDTTNGPTYPEVYSRLCEVFTQVRGSGGRTPQIAFMVNTKAGETARRIYLDLYKPGRFRDLWFFWQGKPLLICDPKQADAELRSFFTLRRAHWPFTQVNTPYAWHWEAAYPQVYGYTIDAERPEQVNVSVAQNLRARDGQVTNMSAGNARGRGFHDGQTDHSQSAINGGLNFAEQWERAIALDPPFVMVTGWNEWIAGRFGEPGKRVQFVDQFNQEFSRDIEPMRGGHADHYYYQLVAGVRRFKGVAPLPQPSLPKTITLDRGFDQWNDVNPTFNDAIGETIPRPRGRRRTALPQPDRPQRSGVIQSHARCHQCLFLRPHSRARQPPHGTSLDVAVHRLGPESPNRLARLRLYRQSLNRNRPNHLARTPRRRLELEAGFPGSLPHCRP